MGAEARALIAGSLIGMIGAVGAAITAEAQETAAEGPGIVGIEQGDLPTAMQGAIQALHDRQTALEAALRDLEARIVARRGPSGLAGDRAALDSDREPGAGERAPARGAGRARDERRELGPWRASTPSW